MPSCTYPVHMPIGSRVVDNVHVLHYSYHPAVSKAQTKSDNEFHEGKETLV